MEAISNSTQLPLRADAVSALWNPNETTGFLPHVTPPSTGELRKTGDRTLEAVAAIANEVAAMDDRQLASFVEQLPPDPAPVAARLSPELCESAIRAMVNVAVHLIHRPFFSRNQALPAAFARPLWELGKLVQRPPSLTYASYVLANFVSPIMGRTLPADLKIAQTPSCTSDEEWFVAVHLAVESAGGEAVVATSQIQKGLAAEDYGMVRGAIETLESCLTFANVMMPTVRERLDPDVFRDRIRPLLYGHESVSFLGVEGNPTVKYIGETGAQSGIIKAIDNVLGTPHSDPIRHSMQRFGECAPPPHQAYSSRSEEIGRRLAEVREPSVREARRSALRALARFRETHLSVVAEYLIPKGQSVSATGTGGTKFQWWLQTIIDETNAAADASA